MRSGSGTPQDVDPYEDGENHYDFDDISRDDVKEQLAQLGYKDVSDEIVDEFLSELKQQNSLKTKTTKNVAFYDDIEKEDVHVHHYHSDFIEPERQPKTSPARLEEDELDVKNSPVQRNSVKSSPKQQGKGKRRLEFESEVTTHPLSYPNIVSDSTGQGRKQRAKPTFQLHEPSYDLDSSTSRKIKAVEKLATPETSDDSSLSDLSEEDEEDETSDEEQENGYDTTDYYRQYQNRVASVERERAKIEAPKQIKKVSIYEPNGSEERIPTTSRDRRSYSASGYDSDEEVISSKSPQREQHEKIKYVPPCLPVRNIRKKESPPKQAPPRPQSSQSLRNSITPRDIPVKPSSRASTGSNRPSSAMSSTSSTRSRGTLIPKKPVTYRKKVHDPVARYHQMNSVWKHDKFLRNVSTQQKPLRWQVRQEMLSIAGNL
jgi:hypothetical protein